MEGTNIIRTDGFLKGSLEEYKETYEQWVIYLRNTTGKMESMPNLEVLLTLAIEDEIKILKDMMEEDHCTVESCRYAHEQLGYGAILNDGKFLGFETVKKKAVCRI